MDSITRDLDDLILQYDFEDKGTDVACCNKVKMDYYLMLTIAATWDMKQSELAQEIENVKKGTKETKGDKIVKCLNRPETGKLISIIDSYFNINKDIVDVFNLYKEVRNLKFGHTTFDPYEAERLNKTCSICWNKLMNLEPLGVDSDDILRKLFQEENDFYYIKKIKDNGDMLVMKFGNKDGSVIFPKLNMKARLVNKDNDIQKGDLFVHIDNRYIKVSPFIQYNDDTKLFMMLMDIETAPLAFKMAYVYRTDYAKESAEYLDEFPRELKDYFPEAAKKIGKNGIELNEFAQYDLFKQEYYTGIHETVQEQLDSFLVGNMAYGAVRGVGGVGKTSAVFRWMNRILNNENDILDSIRLKFNLKRIIFLSAKTKIFSRDVNEENLSNFYNIKSDVSSYKDIIEYIYKTFHALEKAGTTFQDKVDYLKDYSNTAHCILIIIDDYESLPKSDRTKLQQLKDSLNQDVVKLLITTRFAAKESKDIIVERLNEQECSAVADHIFESNRWRQNLEVKELHELTGGLPLLIWYAKAFFQTGQLSSKCLKAGFSGPAEGLEGYLYDNFLQCFENLFTKNFLMITRRYYEIHNVLQISKKVAILLCLEDVKAYKPEDEEFYFQELMDLNLISINHKTNTIDFSPLMLYLDKGKKKNEPDAKYQEDGLKILEKMNEEEYKDLFAVIESVEYVEDERKCRILERIINFAQNDNSVKVSAMRKLFALSEDKIKLYTENTQMVQNNEDLLKDMLMYLLENASVYSKEYELIKEFMYAIAVSADSKDMSEHIADKCLDLILNLLEFSLNEREQENITNAELEKKAGLLVEIANKFINRIEDEEKLMEHVQKTNECLDNISIYCYVEQL